MTTEETLKQMAADVAYLAERQRRMEELVAELQPVAKLAMGAATEELAAMEARGWFRFLRAVANTTDKVATRYGEDELDELGQDVLAVLDTARALTRPELLAVAADAAQVVQNRDALEPVGVLGLVRATGDQDVQRGLAVLFELLRHLGRAADALAAAPARARPASAGAGAPARGSAPARAPAAAPPTGPLAHTAPSGRRPSRMDEIRARRASGAACTPRAPGPVAAVLDGVSYTADGFLADPKQWTRPLGESLAAAAGVAMTDAHWALVDFARKDWEETGASPNIRRITVGAGVTTRDVYTLFPKAPGRTIARIAGVPKPAGCI